MLGVLIKMNLLNIAYLNDLEVVRCEIDDLKVIIENKIGGIVLDEMETYRKIDNYNISVKGNVINFSEEIVW